MADCSVDTFYWLQPTDGSCCKETNMQLNQTFEHYAFSFPDLFVIFIHFCQCQVFSSSFTSLHSGLTEYLGVKYCGCFLKKGNVKFCLVCKHESCHLWCRRVMHIDRVSTKRHDMLTMQLCIGRVFWLHRVGNWVNRRSFFASQYAASNILRIMDEIDFSDCFPIGCCSENRKSVTIPSFIFVVCVWKSKFRFLLCWRVLMMTTSQRNTFCMEQNKQKSIHLTYFRWHVLIGVVKIGCKKLIFSHLKI